MEDNKTVSMDNLYNALIQVFAVILIGYISGRMNLITNSGAGGFGVYVGTFALPSTIFLSLLKIQWNTVNWNFVLAVLIAKLLIVVFVILVTVVITKPRNIGKAGILIIFCTMSNDFAIGFPIVDSLYHDTHKEFGSYVYLVAPISLIIINPIGYIMMELYNCRIPHSRSSVMLQTNKWSVVKKLLKSIFLNPILIMTVLGVIGSFVIPHGQLHPYVEVVLNVFAKSFSATSLFLLGFRMVGKTGQLKGSSALLPGILIIVKLVILPLLIRQFTTSLEGSESDMSVFGFFYGVLPTAAAVFVIAMKYETEVDLMASALVGCTFISAPLMFISAKMISITNLVPANFLKELDDFLFRISIASICAIVLLFFIFALAKKIHRMPHRMTCCLMLGQLILNAGTILWSQLGFNQSWKIILEFCFIAIGQWSTKILMIFYAIQIVLIITPKFQLAITLWPYFVLIGFGVPVVITGIMLLSHNNVESYLVDGKHSPNFQYGSTFKWISIIISITSCLVVSISLILHERFRITFKKIEEEQEQETETITTNNVLQRQVSRFLSQDENHVNQGIQHQNSNSLARLLENVNEDDAELPILRNRLIPSLVARESLVFSYREEVYQNIDLVPLEYDEAVDVFETFKHKVLLVLLLCKEFVNLALSFWSLASVEISGIYIELSFLDGFLNFGQGLLVLACFISDFSEIFSPLLKYWRIVRYGRNVLKLPNLEELDESVIHICEQFESYHLATCRQEIAKNKTYRLQTYRNVFYGYELVDWLLKVGLAQDRISAVVYGSNLVKGRVLEHINNIYDFKDNKLLYKFSRGSVQI